MKIEPLHLLLGAAVVGGGLWMYRESKKKKELAKKFNLKPSEQPDPQKPGYVPPDCTHLEIYESTIAFLRNWAFPLPANKDEFEARVLEAIWAQHPACRGQYPTSLTVKMEGQPEVTESFDDAVDFAWSQFGGS